MPREILVTDTVNPFLPFAVDHRKPPAISLANDVQLVHPVRIPPCPACLKQRVLGDRLFFIVALGQVGYAVHTLGDGWKLPFLPESRAGLATRKERIARLSIRTSYLSQHVSQLFLHPCITEKAITQNVLIDVPYKFLQHTRTNLCRETTALHAFTHHRPNTCPYTSIYLSVTTSIEKFCRTCSRA